MSKAKKKILTIYDLENFYLNHKNSVKFSSEKSGYQLAVQIPMQFETTNESEDGTLKFYDVKAFHIGRNRNHTSVTEDAAKKAMNSMAYKPILANFCEYVDPNTGKTVRDFTGHDVCIDEAGDIQYIEHQIGCFTADAPYFLEENDKKYVCARIAIPVEYSDANAIIEAKGGTKMSVEILVNELSYNNADKVLELTDIVVQGLTCLGTRIDEDGNPHIVEEGMEGSGISLKDFSKSKNSVFSYNDENTDTMLVDTLKKLNATLEQFNINNSGKEDLKVDDEIKIEETLEEVTEEVATEDKVEEFTEVTTEENISEDTVEDAPVEEVTKVQEFEKKNFTISHEDIKYSLYVLLAQIEQEDNEWYFINEVYDDYFVYQGMDGQLYGQKYSKNDDDVTFEGERYPLYAEYLTESERDALKEMRANYSVISEKLAKYEAVELENNKVELLNSADYSSINEKDEYKELVENHAEFSMDELKGKLDEIILSYAKAGQLNFSLNENTKATPSIIRLPEKKVAKKNRYGSIFDTEE